MRDDLEERLATRLQTLADTVSDDLAVPADLELRVQRRRRRGSTTRRGVGLTLAAAVLLAVLSLAMVHRSSAHDSIRIESSSTTAPPVRDPLQPGTVMLAARGQYVISLNAGGHTNATMVEVKDGEIVYARVTDNHHGLWYLSRRNGLSTCGDVVLANIEGQASKLVTKAVAFDVSPDGTRLALYGAGNLADGQCSPVKAGAPGEIAVVDVASWDTSTLAIGNVANLRWSPDGSYLVAASCGRLGCDGLRRIDVPSALGRPLVAQSITFGPNELQPVRSATATFGPGALYVLESTTSGSSSGTQAVYRYDPQTLDRAVEVFTGAAQWHVSQVIPTNGGVYVVAARAQPAGRMSVGTGPQGLYRIDAGGLVAVRTPLSDPGILTPVQPLARG